MHISISEVLVVMLVALLVIKPERFPGLLKKGLHTLQWMKNMTQKIKKDFL